MINNVQELDKWFEEEYERAENMGNSILQSELLHNNRQISALLYILSKVKPELISDARFSSYYESVVYPIEIFNKLTKEDIREMVTMYDITFIDSAYVGIDALD